MSVGRKFDGAAGDYVLEELILPLEDQSSPSLGSSILTEIRSSTGCRRACSNKSC
jgi:hypothetical protein